jgi:hypothetical protein
MKVTASRVSQVKITKVKKRMCCDLSGAWCFCQAAAPRSREQLEGTHNLTSGMHKADDFQYTKSDLKPSITLH